MDFTPGNVLRGLILDYTAARCGGLEQMIPVSRTLVFVALGVVLGCGSEATSSTSRSAATANKLYQVKYSPSPDPIPFSELFELDVTVTDAAGKSVAGATLAMNVTMPTHGHGMQTSPEIAPVSDGRFHVTGMKFHMHGEWQLTFTVQAAAGTDTALFTESFE